MTRHLERDHLQLQIHHKYFAIVSRMYFFMCGHRHYVNANYLIRHRVILLMSAVQHTMIYKSILYTQS